MEEENDLTHELAMAEFDLARTKQWIKEIKQLDQSWNGSNLELKVSESVLSYLKRKFNINSIFLILFAIPFKLLFSLFYWIIGSMPIWFFSLFVTVIIDGIFELPKHWADTLFIAITLLFWPLLIIFMWVINICRDYNNIKSSFKEADKFTLYRNKKNKI